MSEEIFDKYEEIIFNYLANNCNEFDDEHIKQLVNLKVKQYERLQYIIKEVREKANIIQFTIESNDKKYGNLYIKLKDTLQGQELLEILDKVDKE